MQKNKMNKFRKIISIYITITLIITSIQVFATKADTVDEIFVTGGVKYKITSIEKKEVVVVGGQDSNTKQLYIPGEIKNGGSEYNVRQIADNAFKNCNELEEVSLPDTIETIGANAFQNDKKLTGLKLPKNIKTMGYGAFGECTGLTEIEIPKTLEKVWCAYYDSKSDGAFRGCSNLKDVRFEEGTKTVTEYVFKNCTGLEKITIPEGIETIGNGAFSDCGNLTEIIIPESVMKIGEWAFSGCKNLKSVNIMSEVNELKRGVFADCTELSKLNIGDSIEKINGEAFKNVNDVVAYVNKYSKSMFTFIDKNINVQFKNTIDQSNNDSILRKEKTTYFVNSVTSDGQVALNIDFY